MRDALWLGLIAVVLLFGGVAWFAFRGGKGAATVVGVIAALAPRLLMPLIASWFLVLVLTGFVGLATMLAGAALVLGAYVLEPGNAPLLGFCIVVALFVVFTHRSNIARMVAGRENRVRRLWLFRPRAT